MRFNAEMLKLWYEYRTAAMQLDAGAIAIDDFLEVHARWMMAVEKWEHECMSATNYGAF